MARLPYVDRDSASPEVSEVFRKLAERGFRITNMFRMAGHSRAALKPLLQLTHSLLTRADLEAKLRELAVLRMAMLAGCRYVWESHLVMGRSAGVAAAQIADLANWEGSSAFDDKEKAVLAYVDEMLRDGSVKDGTFAHVGDFLSETEIVELTLSAAFWGMLARFAVALQLDVEDPEASSAQSMSVESEA